MKVPLDEEQRIKHFVYVLFLSVEYYTLYAVLLLR